MPNDFRDRTIFITGASLGVGRATARAFHAAGANVVLTARRAEPLEELGRELEGSLVLPFDVADTDGCASAIDATIAHFGALHGLVNNAGAHYRGPLENRSVDEVATMVDVNLRGPLVLTRLALPHLRAAGDGFIVNVGSLAGKVPLDEAATYSATKFGLRAFTYAMAEELRGSGITCSVVNPGPISTGFAEGAFEEIAEITFSQEICSAEDVAEMVVACARDGAVERDFPVMGGKLATFGYVFPALRRALKPFLVAKGRRVKDKLREERSRK